ncbi:MAG: hypothetical protein RLY35_1797 [Bacteroidota bacterium]
MGWLRIIRKLANMEKPILSVNNLCIQAGEKILVEDISFELFPGRCLAIVGESGSGKTLSCLTLLQLNPITFSYPKGEVKDNESQQTFLPTDPRLSEWRGKRIGMIFQEPMSALNPAMRVGIQVAEAVVHHLKMSKKDARAVVEDLFREVRLPDPALTFDKYPHQLSGGQRQRVMIAMALSCNPQILLADEPTTALDPSVQQTVLDLLRTIQLERKMAMIFVSHDLKVVQSVADDIIVMQKGVVMEQGNAKQVIESPNSDYTKALLACKPEGKSKLYYLPTLDQLDNMELIPRNPIGDAILEVDGLTKQYGDFTAVDRVSFVIRKGETLGLVGESGCGKSTLSRMLMGLLPITSGTVSWKGEPWMSSNRFMQRVERKRIQMVFQDPFSSLNPKIPVGLQIMAPMEIHGIGQNEQDRKAKTIYWLEKVGMPHPLEAFDKYPHAFSGGQRQRIVIARALAAEPELIVCDESVAALDVSVQAQVLNLLNHLKHELGLTYLFISHDMNVVNYLCDRVMVMQKGRLIEQG